MKPKKDIISGSIGWVALTTIILVSMLVGMLFMETNVMKPNTIRSNYEYCVKGCVFLGMSLTPEILELLTIIEQNNLVHFCQVECERIIKEDL